MSSPIGVAIIGTGYWGKHYVRLFGEIPTTEVVAVCDKSEAARNNIAARYPDVNLYEDFRDVLALDSVDAIVIATTATHHYDIAKECIAAGKHLLVEKPITIENAHAEDLVRLAAEHNTKLMVGHVYMYNSAIRQAKAYIDEGQMGQMYYVYTQRTNLGPIRNDVNAVWDLAPHDISILNYLMGSAPTWVSAVTHKISSSEFEDVGFINLVYPNSVMGHIHVSWADPSKVRDVVIVGSQQRVYIDDLNALEPIRIFEKGLQTSATDHTLENRFTIRDGAIISPRIQLREPLREQCMHFIDCITNDKKPLSDGQNGLEVVQVLNAIDASIAAHGERVTLGEQV